MDQTAMAYQGFLDMINEVVEASEDTGSQKDMDFFNDEQLIHELADEVFLLVKEREQSLETNCSVKHKVLIGNREKVKRVIQHILQNAIMYTPKGGNIA